ERERRPRSQGERSHRSPPDGKRPMEGQAFEIQAAELRPVSGQNDGSPIIAAVLKRPIGKDSAFRLKIPNRSESEWSFLVDDLSSDAGYNSVLPFTRFTAHRLF
ncbi:MAG: hypothetical protein ABI646_02670, partial [Acidobacteriota bacterium]